MKNQKMAKDFIINGRNFQREGRLEEAITSYQKAIEISPLFSWSYFYLGEALAKSEKVNDAIDAYKQAVKLNPKSALFQQTLENLLSQKLKEESASSKKQLAEKPITASQPKKKTEEAGTISTKSDEVNQAEILARQIYGELPVETFLPVVPVDSQSFLGDVDCFKTLIETVQPQIVIEVGSWKGHSAILMARHLHDLKLHSARVLCVDTWIGSLEHWEKEAWRKELYLKHGYPGLYERFLSNVINSGLKGYIIPFPMTAATAAAFFAKKQIKADLIYIDAAHDYESVKSDLQHFYPLLSQNGIMFGDDFPYPPTGNAIRDFAISKNLGVTVQGRKCVLFRDDQFSKLAKHKNFTLVLEPKSLTKKLIKVLPINSSEVTVVNSEEPVFNMAVEEKIYMYKLGSGENETNILGKDNIIKKACFPANYANESNFSKITYTPKPAYVARLPWALLFSPNLLAISQFKGYWQDSLYLTSLPAIPQIVAKEEEVLMLRGDIEPRVINEPTILLTGSKSNYYHWHINILPIACSLKQKINSGKFRVISHYLSKWEKRSLQLLGIDLFAIEQVEKEMLLCRSLIYSSYLSNIAFSLPKNIKSTFSFVKNCFWENAESPLKQSPEFIFISREDASRRKLLNESEVFSALEPLGFVKVIPGRLSYDQQIQTFGNAKVIVGQHGAGLTNIGFAPFNCKVVEIFSENYINICYWRLTQVLEHKYAYIVAEADEAQKHLSYHQAGFTVSVDAVVSAAFFAINNQ
jgi:capsular polysaccharide biosynthesis protein/tetratricopeptide (TPR) repeat protein